MWNEPSRERLSKLPRHYETVGIAPEDKPVHLHFFLGDCDWYAVEFDGEDTFFGYCILNGDHLSAEWGYFSLDELKLLRLGFVEVDCETEEIWGVRRAGDIPNIRRER